MKKNKISISENKEMAQSLKAKNNIKKKKPRNKNAVEKVVKLVKENLDEVIAKDLVNVINAGETKNNIVKKKETNKVDKKKTELKTIEQVSAASSAINGKETEQFLAKAAKKKAKKLARKLKKQQEKRDDLLGLGSGKEKALEKDVKSDEQKTKQNKNITPAKKEPTSTETIEPKKINPKKQRKMQKMLINKLNELKVDEEEKPKRVLADIEASTVFVGNLPVNTKRIQLVRLFEKYGPVSGIRMRTGGGILIMKHKQRKQAGTLNAYVVLKDAATAENALELNGKEFKTNHLRVTRASKDAHNAGNTAAKHMIFVGNLKYSATEEKLREIFSSCGDINYIRCIHDGEKGCKGVAYVCFKAPDAVGLALELNETMLDERPIHVERYSVKKLGAKEARDNSAQGTKKAVTGAKKRLDNKAKKQGGKALTTSKDSGDKKKSEFRGVKVDGIKKKQKKKQPSSKLKKMAKKIAPNTK